ncbi:choice-of-anchor Q domain-containing protein [Arthrobacter sp. ov118]|uniref:choice-of-anchor Q domain-containing protein n=1 Tax=Arthrobacter sp. ov118 TaxID=1761747 RepID=UPI0008F1913E|nr:choice-of-anchor Q domain-containing protein [Arthrobacter sp. ov118]SFT69197.1 hypothetical protein SAMN04487915_102252 [Arthrobacter sp. ov118]
MSQKRVSVHALSATVVATLLAVGLTAGLPSPAQAAGTTYFISAAGSDSNSGTSSSTPWKSLAKINATVLKPGDTVSLRRGDTWTGGVVTGQSGTAAAPITLNSYGSGSAPTVTGGKSGNCIRINGDYTIVDGLRGVSCGYAGISITGDHDTVRNSSASNNAVGIKAGSGSDFGKYTGNVLTNNSIMNVLTRGTNCGTAQAVNCNDDSGASGVLINGNDNEFSGNTISGSNAFSYDYARDGSSFEIYNGNRNNIHHNVAVDNNNFSEIGRSTGTADGNTYRYNLVRATCGANCTQAKGLIARGPGTSFGPTNGTVFEFNTVYLNGSQSQAVVCHASCPSSTVIRGNILVGVKNSLWINGSGWTERQNVLNGPVNVVLNSTSTTAPARFLNAPSDLHLTGSSPAIDRAGTSPTAFDLAGVAVPQDGDCNGTAAADSGAYEFDSPNC